MAKPKKSVMKGRNPSKKQPAKKPTQTQTQNVNVYYDSRAGAKRKPRKRQPRKEVQRRIPAFNPPPIINFPPQYKPYSVYPEGETAKIFNLNSAVPVPLKIETELLNAPIPAPNLAKSVAEPIREEPFIEDDISVLTEAPEFIDLPEEARSQVLDLPPAEASALVENKEPIFDPFLPVPASAQSLASGRSLAESIAEPPTEAGFSYPYSESGLSLPQSQFLGGPNILFLPPIKAEQSEVPFSPLPSSGLTLAPPLPAKEKPKPFFGDEPPPTIEAPKKGRPKGAKNKPKEEPKKEQLPLFLSPEEENPPPNILGFETTGRILPQKTFPVKTEGQYEFIGKPKEPPKKEEGGLERKRGGGVLAGSEDAFLAEPPLFLAPPAFLTGR